MAFILIFSPFPADASVIQLFPAKDEGEIIQKLHISDIYTTLPMKFAYNDNLYCVLDKSECRIKVLDDSLHTVGVFGRKGQGPEEFVDVYDIDVAQNSIYVLTDNHVKVFSPSGKLKRIISIPREASGVRALAVDPETNRMLLSRDVGNSNVFLLSLKEPVQVLAKWKIPDFEGAHETTQKALRDCYAELIGERGILLRTVFPEMLVLGKDGSVSAHALIPPDQLLASILSRLANKYLSEPVTNKQGNTITPLYSQQICSGSTRDALWILTSSTLCHYNIDTGKTRYFVPYHPLNEHAFPDKLNKDMVSKGHYLGGILGGMWIKERKLILFFKDDIVHVYDLPTEQ